MRDRDPTALDEHARIAPITKGAQKRPQIESIARQVLSNDLDVFGGWLQVSARCDDERRGACIREETGRARETAARIEHDARRRRPVDEASRQ